MLNPRCVQFIKHNVLMMDFEELLSKAEIIDPRINKNTIGQLVSKFVVKGELLPCFYNPANGCYNVLPSYMRKQLMNATTESGKFPIALYRAMRKKAARVAVKKKIDPIVHNMDEPAIEKTETIIVDKKQYSNLKTIVLVAVVVTVVVLLVVALFVSS